MRRIRISLMLATFSILAACGGAETDVAVTPPADPDLVHLTGDLGNRFVHAERANEIVARLRVSASSLRGLRRPPLNLGLVVDTSGSMEGEPIQHAREASLALVEALEPGDRLSIVAFGSRAEVLLEPTVLDDAAIEKARAAIARMEARGTTEMAGGLQTSFSLVSQHLDPSGISRIVLLGDGVPNDPAPIRPLAQACAQRGIPITSLGLGLEFDEVLMGEIAQLSGGRFHYIEESSAVAGIFREEVLRLDRVVARNAVLVLTPGPGVTIDSVVGQNVTPMGPRVQLVIGDLAEGEHRDVFVRMQAQARRPGASVEVLDASLTFVDGVVNAGSLVREKFLGARATADEGDIAEGRNAEVEREAERMRAAAVVVEAIRLARAGEAQRAEELLDEAEAVAVAAGEPAAVNGLRALRRAVPSAAARGSGAAPAVDAASERSIRSAYDSSMGTLNGW